MDPHNPSYVLRHSHPLSWLPDWIYRVDDTPRIELRQQAIVVARRGAHGRVEELEVPHAAVGHLELERPGTIHLRFGLRRAGTRFEVTVPVSRFVAEDEFDHLAEALRLAIPDRQYSIVEDLVLRYARPFDLSAHFDWQLPTTKVTLSPTPLELRSDHTTFRVQHDRGLAVSRDDDEHGGPFMHATDDRVVDRNGTIVALVHRLHRRNLCLVFGSGETVHYHRGQQALFVDGRRVGQVLRRDGGEHVLELLRPLPELLPVLALLVARIRPWIVDPQRLEMQHDEPTPTLRSPARSNGAAWISGVAIGIPLVMLFTVLFAPGMMAPLSIAWLWFLLIPVFTLRQRVQRRFIGYPTHLEIAPSIGDPKQSAGSCLRLTPWDIGQVTRSSAGKLVLQFGIDTRRGEHRTEFALDAKASQQAASELRAWFERHAPDHRYSWQIGDSVHYNQPWQIGDVLPWVTLAGSATLTRRDGVTTIHTASRSFSARHDDDFVLLGCAEVSDDDAVLQVTRRQVLLGNGMILGTRHGRSLQLGNGVTLAVDAGGSVAVDGLDVGRVVVVGDDARLQVDSPLPEITLVLALVVHQDPDA